MCSLSTGLRVFFFPFLSILNHIFKSIQMFMTRYIIFKLVMYTISEEVWVFKRVPHRDWTYFLLYQTINVQVIQTIAYRPSD